jgi:hypothetical protein
MKVYVGEVTVRIPFVSIDKESAKNLHRWVINLLTQHADKIETSGMEVCVSSRETEL